MGVNGEDRGRVKGYKGSVGGEGGKWGRCGSVKG